MSITKAAGVAVLGIALPLMVDTAAEPYADRGIVRSWLSGARSVVPVLAVAWAYEEVFGLPKEPGIAVDKAEGNARKWLRIGVLRTIECRFHGMQRAT
jgi:hypothetical protein